MARTSKKSVESSDDQQSDFHLRPEQIAQLLQTINNFRNRVLIEVLYYMGLRRQEASDLDIRDLDLSPEQARATIVGKGNKRRRIPLHPQLVADLSILTKGRSKGAVFLSSHKKPLSVAMINVIVKDAGIKANIRHPDPARSHLNPHVLRHSFGRNSLHAGMPMNEVQKVMGHSDIATTIRIYGKPSFEQIQASAQKMWGSM